MKKTLKTFSIISMLLLLFGGISKTLHYPGSGIMLMLGFLLMASTVFPFTVALFVKQLNYKGKALVSTTLIIGGVIFILGVWFKVQHYSGAGIYLTLSYSFLSIVFLLSLLIVKCINVKDKSYIPIYILGYFSFSTLLLSNLFTIQHWPGANSMLLVGSVLVFTVFLPLLTYKTYKQNQKVSKSFIFIMFAAVLFILFNFIIKAKVSKDILYEIVVSAENNQITTQIISQANDSLYKKYITNDSSLIKLKEKSDSTFTYIEDLKLELIGYADKTSQKKGLKNKLPYNIKYSEIYNIDNYDRPMYILFGRYQDGRDGKAKELKKLLINYKMFVLNFLKSKKIERFKFINEFIDTTDESNSINGNISWEMKNFYYSNLISDLDILSKIGRNIKIIENEVINKIVVNN